MSAGRSSLLRPPDASLACVVLRVAVPACPNPAYGSGMTVAAPDPATPSLAQTDPYPWASSSPFGTAESADTAARAIRRCAAGETTQRCKAKADDAAGTAVDTLGISDHPAPGVTAFASNPAAAARQAPVRLAQAIALLALVIGLFVGVLRAVS